MRDYTLYEEKFPFRLAQLRSLKGISARDMSLSIGQNVSYINTIENGKALPSMAGFFYICEFLGIEPKDFFDFAAENPQQLSELTEQLKRLDSQNLTAIATIVNSLVSRK